MPLREGEEPRRYPWRERYPRLATSSEDEETDDNGDTGGGEPQVRSEAEASPATVGELLPGPYPDLVPGDETDEAGDQVALIQTALVAPSRPSWRSRLGRRGRERARKKARQAGRKEIFWLFLELLFIILVTLWVADWVYLKVLRIADTQAYPGGMANLTDTVRAPRHRREAQEEQEAKPDPNLFLPTQGALQETLPGRERILTGYDCSRPLNMTAVQTAQLPECGTDYHLKDAKKYTALVLQKADYIRIPVFRCRAHLSVVMSYCGAASHITGPIVEGSKIREFHALSADECRGYWKQQAKVIDERQKFRLQLNSTNHLNWYGPGWIERTATDAWCKTGTWWHNNKKVSNILGTNFMELSLYQEEMTVSETGHMTLEKDGLSIPCKAHEEECETDHGTFFWERPEGDTACPLFKTRETSGTLVTDDHDRHMFMSQDGAMLRLERKETKSRCGTVVYETNYHKLFLTEDTEHRAFNRPLHPDEQSITTYSNVKDQYLTGLLGEQIKKEVRMVRRQECQRELSRKGAEFARQAAEQGAIEEGQTATLGGGSFVTAAGEGWYRYQCRPVQAMGLSTNQCWDALPVTLRIGDAHRMLSHRTGEDRQRVGTPDKPRFFLEPRTRRIVHTAAPFMGALYENDLGDWIRVAPALQHASQPELLTMEDDPDGSGTIDWDGLPYDDGGPYTAQDIQRMEAYQVITRVGRGVSLELQRRLQSRGITDPGDMRAQDLFGELEDQNPMTYGFFRFLHNAFVTYRDACILIVGTAILLRTITWFVGVGMRCAMAGGPGMSIFKRVAASLMPSAYHFFSFLDEKRTRRRAEEETHEAAEREPREGRVVFHAPRSAVVDIASFPDEGYVPPRPSNPEPPAASAPSAAALGGATGGVINPLDTSNIYDEAHHQSARGEAGRQHYRNH